MDSNLVCNHTSNWQNRTTAKRESDLSITSIITDRIGRHKVLLPINHNCFNFRKQQIHLGQNMCRRGNVKVKNSSTLEIPQFFWIRSCCYGYRDQFCYWWLRLEGLTLIGGFNCPITVNCSITTLQND